MSVIDFAYIVFMISIDSVAKFILHFSVYRTTVVMHTHVIH